MKKPLMLMILDGYGLAEALPCNAIEKAKKPVIDDLMKTCPHTSLRAGGNAVGLPEGQMGNSEVGHTNIGAGRVVWQELSRIGNEIKSGAFFENSVLKEAMLSAKKTGNKVHLIGLLSDGGVHSHIDHLLALVDMAKMLDVPKLYVHPILDGRDTAPTAAESYLKKLERHLEETGLGSIADICGRFYAMDRDRRWERLALAYELYTEGKGRLASSAAELLELARQAGENDEFVMPGRLVSGGCSAQSEDSGDFDCTEADAKPEGLIETGDTVIFFNFRPDRARELTRALVDPDFDGFERRVRPQNLTYVCFTVYDAAMPNVYVAFEAQSLKNTFGEYISALGKTQLRIAETEKYAHVTFFFNGGLESPYEGEDRILVPSPKVATYDMKPEMSAFEVCGKAVEAIGSGKYDVIILNFANCDMVGHTGVFEAAVKAVEAVDLCVGRIADAIKKAGGTLLVTADHGNADCMFDDEGKAITAHTTNPVPLILVFGPEGASLKDGGALCDIAPTMLSLMGLEIPKEMTGSSLLLRRP